MKSLNRGIMGELKRNIKQCLVLAILGLNAVLMGLCWVYWIVLDYCIGGDEGN